ncbi:MAG: ABC transporter permease subunit [Candidatus Hydrogenedentes bacterium]|nr:ABC transporter permease subunit [Candidatus Hydrogenedentota bacterium]
MSTLRQTGLFAKRLLLHASLLAGSILFAFPFIWLLSTSAKVPDEMYPLRWLPQIPGGVTESPHMAVRVNERAVRPALVSGEDWDRVHEPCLKAISATAVGFTPLLPEYFWPHLDNEDLAEGIYARLVRRTPDSVFLLSEPEAARWFAQRVDLDLVREVFDAVYRRVSVSEVTLHGWDLSVERPTENGTFTWEVLSGDAELARRDGDGGRPSQEVRYSFANEKSFEVRTEVPLRMDFRNFRKVVVANHADRSWHRIKATIEVGGRRYVSTQTAFTGTDQWQDLTWQFASPDDDTIKMKNWLRLEEAGASEVADPHVLRITLRYEYAPRLLATWYKYTDNYRKVVRVAPITVYARNSVLLVVLNVIGQVLGSAVAAYAFSRLHWPGRDFCFLLVLATLMIPPQVTMIPVFLIFKELGWYNTLRPLWVPAFFGSAFYIFLLRQFMLGIPKDLEDSAKMDGCGYLGILWNIVLPLVKPALATIGVFTFLGVWNDFMGPLIYVTDQRLYPLSLGLFSLQVMNAHAYGGLMAASVLMTLPVIALFFAAQRQFIQGVTLTGLKG